MTIDITDVAPVAHIARDLRQPGAPSMRDLVAASSYRAIRSALDLEALERVVSSEPRLVDDWLGYCADKRTKGGWALDGDERHGWVVWQPFPDDGDERRRHHDRAATACAHYILAELDYWVDVEERRRCGGR